MSLQGIRALLFDMDGVLYHGERVIPEALAFMQVLGDLPRIFITNNPILTAEAYAGKLERLGFARPSVSAILTAGIATAHYLNQQTPGFRYFAVGADGLHEVLSRYGVADAANADYVIVGEGPGIDFETLIHGIGLIVDGGARLICTNPDVSVDAVRDGRRIVVPGGGALVAPFAAAAGVEPLFIGKPEPLLYEMAMERLGMDAHECLMVGDRPDTDILGASRLGMKTALVRTGRFAPGEAWPESQPKPTWDVDDLTQLSRELRLSVLV